MLRYVWMFNLTTPVAFEKSEDWYSRVHVPEVVEQRGPWLRGYRSWYGLPVGERSGHFYNYRTTEMRFDDLAPQPGAGGYTQYEGQDADWGVREAFYSRTETFADASRKPPTAILVPGADGPEMTTGVRELTLIALGHDARPEDLASAASARAGALAVTVSPALAVNEEQLAASFLHPSPWDAMVETFFESRVAWLAASSDASPWPQSIGSTLSASCLTRSAPDHNYLGAPR